MGLTICSIIVAVREYLAAFETLKNTWLLSFFPGFHIL
jgi:hypothetical protein